MPKLLYKEILRRNVKTFFDFSKREKYRILLLLPLLIVMALLFAWQGKPRFEQSFTMYSDARIKERQNQKYDRRDKRYDKSKRSENGYGKSVDGVNGNREEGNAAESNAQDNKNSGTDKQKSSSYSLFRFDPNTIDLDGLVELGFSAKQAHGIINYRNAGAVFRRPEDFARCYTVSDEKFRELLPYINIDLPKQDINTNLHNSQKQIKEEVKNNQTPESAADNEVSVSRSVSGTKSRAALLELNTVDSAGLVAVRGIGALTAARILNYRQRLGGFASPTQIAEIQGMTEQNYEMILQQIYVDSSKIKKIDINFALPESMKGHPYMPPRILNKILKYRQLKGGWKNIRDMVEQNIISSGEAQKLSAYLYFRAE